MTCEEARAAMDAQFEGELAAQTAEQLHAHLATCPSCQERYDRLARVDLSLERGGLSEQRMDALQARILGKASVAPIAPTLPAPRRGGWMTLLAAAAVLVLVAVPAWLATREDGFTPRGGGKSWGVRAFCVLDGRVTGEARAGGTLHCPPGSSVQFTSTAPEPALLSIALQDATRFFPAEGERAAIDAGIDVALPLSTPVGAWLNGPQRVTARFTDANGGVIAESWLVIAP